MPAPLLGYSTVRSRAAGRRTGTVPPIAVVAKVAAGTNYGTATTLLQRRVAIAVLTHPILDRLLLDAGAERDGMTYLVHASASRTATPDLIHALAAVHPTTWRTSRPTHRLTDVTATLGQPVVDALTAAGAAPSNGRPKRLAGASARIARVGAKLRVTPTIEDLTLAGHQLTPGPANRLLLAPADAIAVLDAAQDAGLVVLADRPDDIENLRALAAAACTVTPEPGAPAWARLTAGAAVAGAAPVKPLPALDALAALEKAASRGALVAAHDDVHDVAAATLAAGNPPRREGLHAWQDAFVAAYLAAGPGMVNALPPGAGKTVCAATAMAARAADPDGAPYRAIVLVPASIREQWRTELGTFFPEADVNVIETGAQLVDAAAGWGAADHPQPRVVLLTPQMLARYPDAQQLRCQDLIVDEATFLSNRATATAAAAWTLRSAADHAMVLTGTPDHRGNDAVGELVAFARNAPDDFTEHPYDAPHPQVPHDRAGVLVFAGTDAVPANLPAADPAVAPLDPADIETLIAACARARVAALLEGRTLPPIPRIRTEIEAWRLGLASPAALLSSKYGLAADLHMHAAPAQLGAKGTWVTRQVADTTARGEQTLVFSDFAAALAPLSAHLTRNGIRVATISSAATTKDRHRDIAAFTAGDLDVLLISATGQLGLNLQTAANVIHLDVPTSQATLRQRTARAARLGATHTEIGVHIPALTGTGEDALLAALLDPDPTPKDLATLARHLLDRTRHLSPPETAAAATA